MSSKSGPSSKYPPFLETIFKSSNIDMDSMEGFKFLSKGSYGNVYSFDARFENSNQKHKLALKFIHNNRKLTTMKMIEGELTLTADASNAGHGPEVYGYGRAVLGDRPVGYILMKRYDRTLLGFVKKEKNQTIVHDVILHVLFLLRHVAVVNQFTYMDIQPNNIVLDKDSSGKDVPKLIDFDPKFYSKRQINTSVRSNAVLVIMCIQLYRTLTPINKPVKPGVWKAFNNFFTNVVPDLKKTAKDAITYINRLNNPKHHDVYRHYTKFFGKITSFKDLKSTIEDFFIEVLGIEVSDVDESRGFNSLLDDYIGDNPVIPDIDISRAFSSDRSKGKKRRRLSLRLFGKKKKLRTSS